MVWLQIDLARQRVNRMPRRAPSGKTPSNPNPRLSVRYAYDVAAELEILVEQNNRYIAHPQASRVVDVSINGLKVSIENLKADIYKKLLKKCQYVRMRMPLPGRAEPALLHGQIVWLDYHTPTAGHIDGACNFGIFLDIASSDNYREYSEFITRLERERKKG